MLSAVAIVKRHDGDASRIWSEAADTADLKKRIGALPGFGQMKVMALGSVLAKQFGASAVPAVMRHRGLLVMHASAAVLDEGAVLIGGHSGAGKSTTLAALLKRGFRMLSDDVSVVRFSEDHGLEVLPGPARMRLTERSAAGVGIEVTNVAGNSLGPMRKRAVPTEHSMATAAAPLHALFILRTGSRERVTITTLAGTEKLQAVLACVCGPLLEDSHDGQNESRRVRSSTRSRGVCAARSLESAGRCRPTERNHSSPRRSPESTPPHCRRCRIDQKRCRDSDPRPR